MPVGELGPAPGPISVALSPRTPRSPRAFHIFGSNGSWILPEAAPAPEVGGGMVRAQGGMETERGAEEHGASSLFVPKRFPRRTGSRRGGSGDTHRSPPSFPRPRASSRSRRCSLHSPLSPGSERRAEKTPRYIQRDSREALPALDSAEETRAWASMRTVTGTHEWVTSLRKRC